MIYCILYIQNFGVVYFNEYLNMKFCIRKSEYLEYSLGICLIPIHTYTMSSLLLLLLL